MDTDGSTSRYLTRLPGHRSAAPRLQSTCNEPFAGMILCTADPAKVDKRTRSKWSRVLRYALQIKSHAEPLDKFIKDEGGINSCASRFARYLGRRRGAVAS